MKRKWWLVGIVAVCLVAGACSGSIAAMAVKLQQRLSLGSDGGWEWDSQEAIERRLTAQPEYDSPRRPVPQKPAWSPYPSDDELRRLREAAPSAPDGTLPVVSPPR
jgi:hypothetical protein